MRRFVALLGITLVLALALSSCGGDATGPKTPSLTGSWSGNVTEGTVSLTLVESEAGAVTGSGNLAGVVAVNVTGSHAHPNVSLTLAASGFQSANITAVMSGNDTMTGTLNGSGWVSVPITLTRH